MAKVSPQKLAFAGQGSSSSVGRQSLKFNDQARTVEELAGAFNNEFGTGIVVSKLDIGKWL